MNQKLLGRYIVTDPQICHGQPTFRGTRIMVKQVLEQVASGMAWEAIVEECRGSVSKDAIAEAVRLAMQAFVDHADEYKVELTSA
jgi:uncharacterized protein (DUF433 family)